VPKHKAGIMMIMTGIMIPMILAGVMIPTILAGIMVEIS